MPLQPGVSPDVTVNLNMAGQNAQETANRQQRTAEGARQERMQGAALAQDSSEKAAYRDFQAQQQAQQLQAQGAMEAAKMAEQQREFDLEQSLLKQTKQMEMQKDLLTQKANLSVLRATLGISQQAGAEDADYAKKIQETNNEQHTAAGIAAQLKELQKGQALNARDQMTTALGSEKARIASLRQQATHQFDLAGFTLANPTADLVRAAEYMPEHLTSKREPMLGGTVGSKIEAGIGRIGEASQDFERWVGAKFGSTPYLIPPQIDFVDNATNQTLEQMVDLVSEQLMPGLLVDPQTGQVATGNAGAARGTLSDLVKALNSRAKLEVDQESGVVRQENSPDTEAMRTAMDQRVNQLLDQLGQLGIEPGEVATILDAAGDWAFANHETFAKKAGGENREEYRIKPAEKLFNEMLYKKASALGTALRVGRPNVMPDFDAQLRSVNTAFEILGHVDDDRAAWQQVESLANDPRLVEAMKTKVAKTVTARGEAKAAQTKAEGLQKRAGELEVERTKRSQQLQRQTKEAELPVREQELEQLRRLAEQFGQGG